MELNIQYAHSVAGTSALTNPWSLTATTVVTLLSFGEKWVGSCSQARDAWGCPE